MRWKGAEEKEEKRKVEESERQGVVGEKGRPGYRDGLPVICLRSR